MRRSILVDGVVGALLLLLAGYTVGTVVVRGLMLQMYDAVVLGLLGACVMWIGGFVLIREAVDLLLGCREEVKGEKKKNEPSSATGQG